MFGTSHSAISWILEPRLIYNTEITALVESIFCKQKKTRCCPEKDVFALNYKMMNLFYKTDKTTTTRKWQQDNDIKITTITQWQQENDNKTTPTRQWHQDNNNYTMTTRKRQQDNDNKTMTSR